MVECNLIFKRKKDKINKFYKILISKFKKRYIKRTNIKNIAKTETATTFLC